MRLIALWVALALGAAVGSGQTIFTESFRGTSASGWYFGGSGGSTAPFLTAAQGIDADDSGWLRLTQNTANQSTYALLDSAIFSVNAQIQIEMDYAFWNGSGADGITFFLVDGSATAQTFQPGSYGGSMGYAQRTGEQGMPGAYLGFALDNYGNFANPTEGRNGGVGFRPNSVTVRGPESSNYEFVATSGTMATQMDFPSATTRPDQSGADFRSFRITLDANNQLNVEMRFGAGNSYNSVLTADLSGYDRPDYFKIGLTGATGGLNEIHEVRNLQVTMTPWQPTAVEWDNGAGTTAWSTGANWVGDAVPTSNSDVLFGDAPATGAQAVVLNSALQLNSLTFDSDNSYSLSGSGTITLGNTGTVGLPSINVNDYNGAQAQHHIANALSMAEDLKINNYSFSTLCLNGAITTGGNDITVAGHGAVNFNADINGSGGLIKNGSGLVTINNNNADGGTPWTGDVTINKGMVTVTANGALGTTGGDTTVNSGGTLAFRGDVTYTTAESVTLDGSGIFRGNEGYVGALYNDGGTNSFAGSVTLGSDATIGSRDGTLTLSGVVSGNAALTKVGAGVVELSSNANDWRGNTYVNDGVLRLSGGVDSLAGGFATNDTANNYGAVILGGGVLEIGTGSTFQRRLGTGEEQVAWAGDGGFSAYGGARTVTLTNSGGTANGTLTWNAGSFVPTGNALLLSSDYSDNTVTLTNAIDFAGGQREVRVADGTAAVDGVLSGNLTNGGLVKSGAGTLNLTGTNSYTGATEIQGGALRGGVPSNSNVTLNGGVLELTSDLTRSLGTGGTNLQWTGDGGFSASGGNRTVAINNSTAAVTWGTTTNFVGADHRLILGSGSADSTVIFNSGLNLGGGTRTILVQDGSAAEDARLAQVVSNGSLNVVGAGRLDATAANTLAGSVTVSGAELRLTGSGTMTSVTGITVNEGGTLTLDNAATNSGNRVNNSAGVTLDGGTVSLLGRTGNNNTTETVGTLTLAGGANTVNVQRGDASGSAQLTFAGLTREAGATVDFTNAAGGGTLGNTGDNPRIIFTSAPTEIANVLGYATVNGSDFAGHAPAGGGSPDGIYAIGSTNTAQGSWTSTTNAAPGSDQGLTASRTVGSLKLGDGIDVDLNGNTLTIASGGLLSTGATVSTISDGTLLTGTGMDDLIAHVFGAGGLDISAVVANNSGAKGLTKTGDGELTFSGSSANTYTGTTYVNAGTLTLGRDAFTTAIAGNLVIGDGRGTDTVRLRNDEQIADTATVTLNGGTHGGSGVLKFDGAGGAGVTETFATLDVSGPAVVDFTGGTVCDANFLYLDDLLMSATSELIIRNWVEFTDFILVKNTSTNVPGLLDQIQFDGYGSGAYWVAYNSEYAQITPVPEPATYGALLVAAGAAFAGWRRRRMRSAA